MSDLRPVEVLTRHLAALTADMEQVLREPGKGRYGPDRVAAAIAETVAHIAALREGASDES